MNIVIPGHIYELTGAEGKTMHKLEFYQREEHPHDAGKLRTVRDGLTNEAVIAVLIDRIQHLNGLLPCPENAGALEYLEQAQACLEKRTEQRRTAGVEGTTADHLPGAERAEPEVKKKKPAKKRGKVAEK